MSERDEDTDRPGARHSPELEAIAGLAECVADLNEHAEETAASIRGIHKGIGDGDRSVKGELKDLRELLTGLSADVRTALSTIPMLTKRIITLEATVESMQPETHLNGTASTQ